MWYVYILQCADGHLYTGCTSDVVLRLSQHECGEVLAMLQDLICQVNSKKGRLLDGHKQQWKCD